MKNKLILIIALLVLLFLPASVSEAAEVYLSKADGGVFANVQSPYDAYVCFGVYDSDFRLIEAELKKATSGENIVQKLEAYKSGSGMTVKLFCFDENIRPLKNAEEVTFPNSLAKSGIEFEAEDIAIGNTRIVSDDNASGAKAVKFISHRWNLEDALSDDMYAKIYVNSPGEPVRYNVWMRAYTTSNQTASIFQDLNKGTFATNYFSSTLDYTYRWDKSEMYLNPGDNYIAFRWRGPCMIDKFIITSNLDYVPEGFGYLPEIVTEEELEKEWATLYAEPEIKPIEGHPRLYVTKDTIDELKKNLACSENGWMYTKFKGYANETLNCKLDTSLSKNHNSTLLVKIMSRALVWLVGDETDINHARQTIAYMRDYLDTVRTPDDEGDITRVRGDIMVGAAVVYDWCYDALSDDDKEYFIAQFKKIAASKEIGWPPVNMSSVASHGGEQEIFRDLLSAGVAIYDEYPLMYNLAAGRLFEKMLPARMWLRSAGRFDQGNDYAECRYYSEMWADAIFQKMGYGSIYGDISGKPLYWLIRSRLPYGSMMPSGDMYSLTHEGSDTYYSNYVLSYAIAAGLYDDPYIKQEFRRRFSMGSYGVDIQFWYTIFNNPDTEAKVWDDMNLTFISDYPLSGAISRTSWQEGFSADTAMAFLNMHEVFIGDHQNIYTGDFQLYYKGLLAMNTGTYNASTAHNEGYKRRAIAGNTMLCYDPDETFVPTWSNVTVPNDGGQRTPYVLNGVSKGSCIKEFSEFQTNSSGRVQNRDLIVAENVSTYHGPNKQTPAFTYVGGNLTNAYSDKVSYYKRDMVFMDLFDDEIPAAFVVYDKMISQKPEFKKSWLIHSMQKPEINENGFTIVRNQDGFGGKLEAKILLPENPEVSVVGGDNNEMFTVGGILMAPKPNTIEGGKYRTEVSPSVANKEDVFLHAMFMTDSDSDASIEMTKYETDEFIGVALSNRLVLFAKDDSVAGDFELDITALKSETLVFISGLSNDKRSIDGRVYAPENGCITLKLMPGKYKASLSDKTPDSITWQTEEKKKIGDFFVWHTTTGAAKGKGNFINLENPTLVINETPYIGVATLSEFGATVRISGDSAEVSYGGKTVTAVPGKNAKNINGIIYVNPNDFKSLLNYTFSYNSVSNMLIATKQ